MRRFETTLALIEKEWLQVFRDPSALLVAFVLPILLLFIFGYGLSLDAENVKIAVVLEDRSPDARVIWNTLVSSHYFDASLCANRKEGELALRNGEKRALVVVPNDFTLQMKQEELGKIQVLTDGSDTNLALIIENYLRGAYLKTLSTRERESNRGLDLAFHKISVEGRTRFNEEQITRNNLVPGSISLIVAMIGTLLTTFVVAREWERGTMEATLSTPIAKFEMIVGKIVPYFLLGLVTACGCAIIARCLFEVPFRGTFLAFVLSSSAFLLVATSQGLLISSIFRSQSVASQIALLTSFLPNFILSGVIFEIDAMPVPLQILTYFFPARYYVVCLQTVFMAGDLWSLFFSQISCMTIIAAVTLVATVAATPERLE